MTRHAVVGGLEETRRRRLGSAVNVDAAHGQNRRGYGHDHEDRQQ
jgi:hypothetical protein